MKAKTLFIVILTAIVTMILMKNADEVEFWIFGTYMIPKLAVLGTMFVLGIVVGLMLGRNKKRATVASPEGAYTNPPWDTDQSTPGPSTEAPSKLSEEDSEYIR